LEPAAVAGVAWEPASDVVAEPFVPAAVDLRDIVGRVFGAPEDVSTLLFVAVEGISS
jgi:hypothetical protein